MDYYDRYRRLKDVIDYDVPAIPLDDGARVVNLEFHSRNDWILPGGPASVCPTHRVSLSAPASAPDTDGAASPGLEASRARENREFRYHVFLPGADRRSRAVILLFHGFNEKYWHKYLPWAHRLMARTGRAVILFPIAFHMNRAPAAWSDRRLMYRVCEGRKRAFPAIIASTLSNAAISTRLQSRPDRFFWAGLQSYYDVVQLLDEIAGGAHPLVDPAARIDLFGYSIGCLLAQILLMTDPGGRLEDTRLCMFCGGTVFNRMSPVSRFILDSECNVALYSYVVEHLESHLRANERLRHHLGDAHPEGVNFRSMLHAVALRREREAHFRRLGSRLLAVALESDAVIPPGEVMNTLQGPARTLPARVEVLEFPYACCHEDPFPALAPIRGPVDEAFTAVFDLVAEFYREGRGAV
jgi:pimeloyl-ACP methyl ester carboxylesterase